jgi:ABC-2 type transport system ATP-binding protein
MITGAATPDRGRVTVAGLPMGADAAAARRMIGYLPESAPLYPEMSPRAFLHHRAALFGVPRRDRRRAVDAALDRCGVATVARRRIGTLSKGYRQRVGLASTLVHDPEVLILDEPTNGLDPNQIRAARSLIRELAERRTMLVCSHILPEIERTCDRVLVLARGKLRADGSPAELLARAGGAVEIEARAGDGGPPLSVMQAVPGVGRADLTPTQPIDAVLGWTRVRVEPAPGTEAASLREPLAAAGAAAGLAVRELALVRPTLESLFVRLTDEALAESEAAAAGAAA